MIVEKQNSLFSAIVQIIKLYEQTKSDNYYMKIGVVRVNNNEGESYDVEVISDVFDINTVNESYMFHEVVNICPTVINVNSLVYLDFTEKRVPVIIEAKDLDVQNILTTTSITINTGENINLSGGTVTEKFSDSYKLTDKDDNLLVEVTADAITTTIKTHTTKADTIELTGNNGGKIEVTDKIALENNISSLKDILSDLISALNQNVVPDCTLVAPYGAATGAALAAALTQLQTKVSGLLK